jgi:hypothetical protein
MSTGSSGVIVIGVFLLLLTIVTAMGAVSLGAFNTLHTNGAYLVDSPFFEFLALVFAGLGGYFLYRAGQMKGAATKLKSVVP